MSIQRAEFSKDLVVFKVIFRNQIGKLLYDGQIDAKQSKAREVPEKAFKNQLKIAVINKKDVSDDLNFLFDNSFLPQSKLALHFCKINFSRKDDLHEFEKAFKLAVEKKMPEGAEKES